MSDVLKVRIVPDDSLIESDTNPDRSNDPVPEETTDEEERYVLPPRRNRGVPPKRYSLEHEPQASRYSVGNLARGRGSEEAKAYITALYTEEIPKCVEQAKSNKEWREAMQAEIDALAKNGT